MARTNPLASYNAKRNFKRTAEPAGKRKTGKGGNSFVVQKHDATRLHWDFRIEVDGVLKSRAATKGPNPDPGDKRLVVCTEDYSPARALRVWRDGDSPNKPCRISEACLNTSELSRVA